jgi:hypothetical protein
MRKQGRGRKGMIKGKEKAKVRRIKKEGMKVESKQNSMRTQ